MCRVLMVHFSGFYAWLKSVCLFWSAPISASVLGYCCHLVFGLDVHKYSISEALAEEGRDGDVRFLGDFENTPAAIAKFCRTLSRKAENLELCYEAGCCGYGIYRQLTSDGHNCMVVAPSRIPRAPGDRIKTDRRDAQRLAVLHRSGDLTRVWVT